MSFKIKHGLFKASITDYHAILGVSLDADPKKIRLKYLRIAQKLHPDTCKADPERKKLAGQILSKLVNPAYEQLSNKTSFAEHQLVLTQIGKRYAEKSNELNFASESAKKLLETQGDLSLTYERILKKINQSQYQDIDRVLGKIAAISELNLVYLLLNHQKGISREEKVIKKTVSAPAHGKSPEAKASQPEPEVDPTKARVDAFVRRAKEYMAKGRTNDAISELRDALKLDPNSSTAHALMGRAYMIQNQLTMAKVHINKAHAANPQDPVAIQSKEQLEKLTKKQERRASRTGTKDNKKDSKKAKSGDSGFLSGFFGSKKK